MTDLLQAGRWTAITIQTMTDANTGGSLTETASTFASWHGKISALRGSERFLAQREHGEVDHRIEIRHKAGIVPKMRVVAGSRTFDIQAVIPDQHGRKTELLCKEFV